MMITIEVKSEFSRHMWQQQSIEAYDISNWSTS